MKNKNKKITFAYKFLKLLSNIFLCLCFLAAAFSLFMGGFFVYKAYALGDWQIAKLSILPLSSGGALLLITYLMMLFARHNVFNLAIYSRGRGHLYALKRKILERYKRLKSPRWSLAKRCLISLEISYLPMNKFLKKYFI